MSDNQKPVAWHVIGDGYEYSTLLEEHARAVVEEEGGTVAPLYRSPTITLTDAEREAVELAYSRLTADTNYASVAATLRGLLERMGGER